MSSSVALCALALSLAQPAPRAEPKEESGYLVDFAPLAKIERLDFEPLLYFSGKLANGGPIKLPIPFRDASITEIRDEVGKNLEGFRVKPVDKTKLLISGYVGTDGKLIPITELKVRGWTPRWPEGCHPTVTKAEAKKK